MLTTQAGRVHEIVSRVGMGAVVDLPQPPLVDMRVDLRGGQAGMSQQFLHQAQVRATLQHMAGTGMAVTSTAVTGE